MNDILCGGGNVKLVKYMCRVIHAHSHNRKHGVGGRSGIDLPKSREPGAVPANPSRRHSANLLIANYGR